MAFLLSFHLAPGLSFFIPVFTVVPTKGLLLQVLSLASTLTLNTVPHCSCVSVQVVLEDTQEADGTVWPCM